MTEPDPLDALSSEIARLRNIARGLELTTLAYLLEMARLEAAAQAKLRIPKTRGR